MMLKVAQATQVENRTNLLLDGECRDAKAWNASCRIDGRRDAAWFRKHPEVTERTRNISRRESKALGFPMTATVRVVLMPDGNLWRIFPDRNDRRSND